MAHEDRTRRRFLATAGSAVTVALAGCSSGGDGGTTDTESMETETTESMGTETESMGTETESMGTESTEGSMSEGPVTFTVRIENVASTDVYGMDTSTGGAVWVTPGAFAVHSGPNPIYTVGEEASVGLEALAEAGPPTGFPDEPGLIDELQGMTGEMGVASAGVYTPENTVADPNDPKGSVPGAPPIAPGGAFKFELEAEQGAKFSFASMFVPSNDLFLSPGPDGIPLWTDEGDPIEGNVTQGVMLWDAGTEPNANPPGQGPDQAPAQDSPTQGADEGGVVRHIDDVMDGYSYPAVSDIVRVTVTPSMEG